MKYFIAFLLLQITLTATLNMRTFNITSPFPVNGNGRSIIMSGNIASNQLTGNKNTTIQNQKFHTINSNNTDHSTVINRNSYNKISTIKKSGNVSKQINQGEINMGNGMLTSNLPFNPHSNSTAFRNTLKEIMHSSLYKDDGSNFLEQNNNINNQFIHRHLKNN